MKQSSFLTTLFNIAIIALAISAVWIYFLSRPVVNHLEGANYNLRVGLSKKLLAEDLKRQGIQLPHPDLLYWFLYLQPQAELKAGEYFFPKNSTSLSILKQVTQARGLVNHHFTIVPGWTFQQLRQELAKDPSLNHVSAHMTDQQIMQRLGFPAHQPEGEFFPDTYHYARGVSDLVILRRAFMLMQQRLANAWNTRQADLPYKTAYEALIAASLVEKEGFDDAERPLIAGVLINRLRKNMLLQFDPTVIYGLGNRYDGNIHKEDLLDKNSYNTYVHLGLPPTPIGMPSLISINAALHPKETNYLYFVAKGDGRHQFSSTLAEHSLAISLVAKTIRPNFFNKELLQAYVSVFFERQLKEIYRQTRPS